MLFAIYQHPASVVQAAVKAFCYVNWLSLTFWSGSQYIRTCTDFKTIAKTHTHMRVHEFNSVFSCASDFLLVNIMMAL